MKVRLSIADIWRVICLQETKHQRVPYPIKTIIEKAGVDFDSLESISPSTIRCSQKFALFVIKYDRMEMDRLSGSWMPGGWFLNKGPAVDNSLQGLEFDVDVSQLTKEKICPK